MKSEGVDRIQGAQDRNRWRALVTIVTKSVIQFDEVNFLTT
jgi:hypothetical protein